MFGSLHNPSSELKIYITLKFHSPLTGDPAQEAAKGEFNANGVKGEANMPGAEEIRYIPLIARQHVSFMNKLENKTVSK